MRVATVRVTSQGRITIPADVLRNLRPGHDRTLLVIHDGPRIVLVPAGAKGETTKVATAGPAVPAPAFDAVWDNPADEDVWDKP